MTEMCKAVNIPALQDHNSLKASGGDHTGRCEAHSNPFLPYTADPNRSVAVCSRGVSLCVDHKIKNKKKKKKAANV